MRVLLLGLATLLASCGDVGRVSTLPFEPAGPSAAPDPVRPGPYPVGVRTVTLVDESRLDAKGQPRSLLVEVWYPAVDAARGQPGASYDLSEILTAEQLTEFSDVPPFVLRTAAVRDAEARAGEGPFPLVVYSHGHGAVRWQSTFYTVNLASHGYVVVSADHTGDRLYDAVRDRLDDVATAFAYRPEDVYFLIDSFTMLPAGHFLAGLVDGARVGVTGHSFGGLTSLRAAAYDTRIKAIVPQAPASADLAFVGLGTSFALSIPVMLQVARGDLTLPWDEHAKPTWDRLVRPRAMLDVTRGGHFTFSDLCAFRLVDVADRVGFADLGNVIEDGCNAEQPSAAVAQPMLNHFAIGFFNWTLRGSPGSRALLDQARAEAIAAGVATFTDEL
jgi:predicted dienelactone hydrolase